MPFHAGQQQKLITERPYSPAEAFSRSIITHAPWDSIVDFATHPSFCGMTLYPRQQTLLRLIFMETEQMTQYDRDVIEEWRKGFMQRREVFGVQPDIWERIAYLKERGYRRFPEVQAVLGRRASKGMIGGILGAEQMAYMFSLDDWQAHYGVVPGKDGYLTVVATSQSQAKRHQFRDIAMTIEGCAYLQPHIASSRDCELAIRTPADMRQLAALKAAGMAPDHEVATLHAIAMASNSDVVRGAASFGLFLDEFAFMVQGTGSSKSGEEVYESATPSLDQFDPDALVYIPSSPFTKTGQFFTLYKQGSVLMKSYTEKHGVEYRRETEDSLGVDAAAAITEMTADPLKLVFQGPSWAQPVTTPVLTPQGWRPMGDLVAGDFVIGSDGHPTKITGVRRRGVEPAYLVTMNDGSATRTSAEHLWSIQDWNERAGNMKPRGTIASTAQVATLLPGDPKHARTFIPMVGSPPVFDTLDEELPIPGYLLGYLLGDGCFRAGNSPRVALTEPEQNTLLEQELTHFPGMKLVYHSGVDWGIVSGYQTPSRCSLCSEPPTARGLCPQHYSQAKYRKELERHPRAWVNLLGQRLFDLGLGGVLGPDKFVPASYLVASPDQRLAVLQGLMDADGSYAAGKHSAIFFNVSRQLCEAVVELTESLGGQARMYPRPPRGGRMHNGKIISGKLPSWHVSVRLPGQLNPFRLPRKAEAYQAGIKENRRAVPVRKIVSVAPAGDEEMQCIEVDAPDGLYVTEHYIVTHNCLYQDWERGEELVGRTFRRPIQPDLTSESQRRRMQRNPEKFRVERLGQFAEVQAQYLDPEKVEQMFAPLDWRPPLEAQAQGRFDRKYRIHCDPGRCLVGDTYINTDHGMVKIVQVAEGDRVVTRDGIDSVVEWVPNGIKDVYRLTLRGGWEIRATGNHPVWTTRGWVPLLELGQDDKVQVRMGANLWPQCYVEIPPVRMPRRCNGRICFPSTDIVNEKMGRLFGYIAAEGSIQETMLTITSHVDEKLVDEVAELIRDLFGIEPSWERVKGKARMAGWGNSHLMLLLQALGFPVNEHCRQRAIPWSILQSPRSVVAQFISAYFSGDGCVSAPHHKERSVSVSSASGELDKQLQCLQANFGIYDGQSSGWQATGWAGSTKTEYWRLSIRGKSLERFRDEIGFLPDFHEKVMRLDYLADLPHNADPSEFHAVRSLVADGREPTYDLSMQSEHHNFLANGVVCHNTNANFAMAIAHLEDAPCTGCGWRTGDGGTGWANTAHVCPNGGQVWPHVIFDLLHVWRPQDFPADVETGRRTIDYIQVDAGLRDILRRFRSTEKVSFDQWNCIAAGTLISTDQGLQTIRDFAGCMDVGEVRQSTDLIRSRGSTEMVRQVYRRGETDTLRFTALSGIQLECTPEHRLWVRRQSGDSPQDRIARRVCLHCGSGLPSRRPDRKYCGSTCGDQYRRYGQSFNPPGWLRAGEIRTGDELFLQRGYLFPDNPVPMAAVAPRTSARPILKDEVDEDVAAFLGYIASEGCYRNGTFRFCQKDTDVVSDFCDVAEAILGRTPTRTHRTHTSKSGEVTENTECRIGSTPLAQALGFDQPRSEHISTPSVILRSPRKVVTAYLSALFEGDGGVTPDGISYWSASETLTRETQQLLLGLGIYSRIRRYAPSRSLGIHDRWVLTASGPEAIRFCEEIGFRSPRKQQQAFRYMERLRAGRTLGAKRARFLEGDEVRDPVIQIEPSRAECYDLSVPATECYIANGVISHNSASFISNLRQEFSPAIRVTEVTFTEKVNQERCEKFKAALNLGWVSAYRDNFYDANFSLLEQELKFLSEKNGKVVKQDFGPVTTKDLADCAMQVTVDLLHDALDRWSANTLTASAYGSSDIPGLKSGREFDRIGGNPRRTGRAWQDLERQRNDRLRGRRYSPSRTSSIRTRDGR